MSYRLAGEAPLTAELREVVLAELDDAVRRLREEARSDPVVTVHEARKDLKKARALLRLVRSALPADERQEDRQALRDAARRLSPYRDRDVAGQAVDDLRAEYAALVDDATWATVRGALEEAAERAVAPPLEAEAAEVADEIARVRERLAERLGGESVRWRALHAGLRRTYARGRAGRRGAERGDDPALRHDWRKRVKDRWYHERLLEEVWPELVGAQVGALDELGETLGREHDFVLLEARLRAMPAEHGDAVAPLVERLASERAALWGRARGLGDRLYAEKPKAYERRLGRYARRWRAERRAGAAASPSRRS